MPIWIGLQLQKEKQKYKEKLKTRLALIRRRLGGDWQEAPLILRPALSLRDQ